MCRPVPIKQRLYSGKSEVHKEEILVLIVIKTRNVNDTAVGNDIQYNLANIYVSI